MILYKYMSFQSASKVMNNSSIVFSCLEDLNDPFEGTAICFEESDTLTNKLQKNSHRSRLSRNYGVLSLTRNPLNPLMWSHYGDDHRGVVIGIDMKKANFLDENSCVIPAQYGEIVYTSTMPQNMLPTSSVESLMSVGTEHKSFRHHNYDLFKNTFLLKDLTWGYEEEVRVVKNINGSQKSRDSTCEFENEAGTWNQVKIFGRPLYCLSIPKESIVEAYLGCATNSNVTRLGMNSDDYLNARKAWQSSGVNVQLVRRKEGTWNLEVSDYKI
ncbi:DUF2971 domain-containing protein [Vibrio sp. Vb339]|uniref:DUF2971 domain-containing protein n=1 Tax=Vibrio sp. Vb339 TaxID=1192013 RepID=UPI0015580588|nr:DUF2971 domain-containing protein [Vibrio sp. Vb339]